METFSEWLLEEMGRQKMSQQSLAQKSGITPAQVSRVISGQRGLGEKSLIAIARALKLPPETVFRAAGILPQQTEENELIQRITHLTKELPKQEQEGVFEFVKMRHRLVEEHGKNESKRTRNKPAIP